jgi:RNA polymerase sigma-70 factor (ECF subfamily)
MTLLSNPNDAELLRSMAAGNEDAFVALYRRRQGAVYRFALQMSGSAAVAEEVTQEVFMALIREGGRYDPARGSLAAYLYGVARNHVLRCLEKDRPYVPMADEPQNDNRQVTPAALVSKDDPAADLVRRERIESVRRAVLALPPHYREVVVLCDLHEMSYAEAAAATGCAIGTIRSRLHRGRALLAQMLEHPEQAAELAKPALGNNPARCFV